MDSSKRTRYVLFGIGAALGSAVGLVLGSLLAYWIGDEAVRAIQRGFRKITGGDDRPNFEMLLQ
jgi:hypothetical protein